MHPIEDYQNFVFSPHAPRKGIFYQPQSRGDDTLPSVRLSRFVRATFYTTPRVQDSVVDNAVLYSRGGTQHRSQKPIIIDKHTDAAKHIIAPDLRPPQVGKHPQTRQRMEMLGSLEVFLQHIPRWASATPAGTATPL